MITVALPTNRSINPKTAQCLMNLVAQSKHDLHIVIAEEGYTIAENRNYIAVQAINAGSTHLLMVDDDMTFPPDILDTLLANDKDICGSAYHPRSADGEIVKYINAGSDGITPIRIEKLDDPQYKVPFKCYATGTGIILIKCSVFSKVPRPWFMFEYHETGQCKLGEDWYFCIKAGKVGIETWCDPRPKVGHLGEIILTGSVGDSLVAVAAKESPAESITNTK